MRGGPSACCAAGAGGAGVNVLLSSRFGAIGVQPARGLCVPGQVKRSAPAARPELSFVAAGAMPAGRGRRCP